MRIWTIHPKYLDAVGLVALWRESLLAQAVLRGRTKGYKHHPQLIRFRERPNPVESINRYLVGVYEEALERGYAFDKRKLGRVGRGRRIVETSGQLALEWHHLQMKLRLRSPERHGDLMNVTQPEAHPLFRIVAGEPRIWEHAKPR